MQIDIGIKVDGKQKGGLMGVSLDDIKQSKPVIIVKKKKKKKSLLTRAVESTIPATSKYTTESV